MTVLTEPVTSNSHSETRFANRTLQSGFSWMLLGNVALAACQWAILMVLTKTGTVHQVGYFALGLAISSPVFAFLNLELRQVLTTDHSTQATFRDYLKLRVVTSTVGIAIMMAVAFLGPYPQEAAQIIGAVAIYKLLDTLSDLYFGLFQRTERLSVVGKSQLANGVLSVLLFSIGMATTHNVELSLLLYAAASLIVLLFWIVPQARGQSLFTGVGPSDIKGQHVATPQLLAIAGATWTLGLGVLLVNLSASIPRFFVESLRGADELGVFAALSYITVVGGIVMNAIAYTAAPKMASLHVRNDHAGLRHLLLRLSGLVAIMTGVASIIAYFIGDHLIAWMYSPDYAGHNAALILFIVGAGVHYTAVLWNFALIAVKKYTVQLFANIAAIVAITGASTILIPRHGLEGAAISMIAGPIIKIVISYIPIRSLSRNSSTAGG